MSFTAAENSAAAKTPLIVSDQVSDPISIFPVAILLRRSAARVVAVLVAVLLCSLAQAGFISGDDLFLAPIDVPKALYDPLVLETGDSHTFSAADILGASTLLGVRVLPLLNPNPATVQGEYSLADLGSITLRNYGRYFAFQPNIDYTATSIEGNASNVSFGASGSYFVQLRTSDGSSESVTLQHVFVSDDFLPDDAAKKAGPARTLAEPGTDLILISEIPGDRALDAARKHFPTAPTVKNLADIKKKLEDYYNAHGKKKFSVTLIGHGSPGRIDMGNESITNDGRGTMKAGDFQHMIDTWVSKILFYSCLTQKGDKGTDFFKQFRESMTAGGWADEITSGEKSFDADAGAKLGLLAEIGEPSTLTLLLAFVVVWPLLQMNRGGVARHRPHLLPHPRKWVA